MQIEFLTGLVLHCASVFVIQIDEAGVSVLCGHQIANVENYLGPRVRKALPVGEYLRLFLSKIARVLILSG